MRDRTALTAAAIAAALTIPASAVIADEPAPAPPETTVIWHDVGEPPRHIECNDGQVSVDLPNGVICETPTTVPAPPASSPAPAPLPETR